MKRVPIFLLLGPTMVVLIALSGQVIARGAVPGGYVEGCAMLFFFSLILCTVTGPVDGVLAYVLPICLRAPLTAIVGAAVAVGLRLYVDPSGEQGAAVAVPRDSDGIHLGCSHWGAHHGRMLIALAQLSQREDPTRRPSLFPVMNHLTSPLNASFTLSQPEGDRLIAP
jgi:hypothetical protein